MFKLKTLQNIENDDLKDNFGVFPLNYINTFINHAAMMSDEKGKYPLLTLTAVKKEVYSYRT